MANLYGKVYGCLAALRVASAMGAPVETYSRERIEATFGIIDRFHSYEHDAERGIRWAREPGTTEDGIERQNLQCRAIIAKGDRDTDCLGAMAAGLTGALSGASTLPEEWVEQVDAATAVNPYTNTNWTIKQHADGLCAAVQNRAGKIRDQLCVLEG